MHLSVEIVKRVSLGLLVSTGLAITPAVKAQADPLRAPVLTDRNGNTSTIQRGGDARSTYRNQSATFSDFGNVDMNYSIFENMILDDSQFIGAKLTNTQFGQSSLQRADFRLAKLSNTYFIGSDLTNADLSQPLNTSYPNPFAYFNGGTFTGTNFSGFHFAYGSTFRNSSFRNANLRGVYAPAAFFENADFTGADLTDGYFKDARWINVTCPNGVVQSTSCIIPSSTTTTIKTTTTTTIPKKKTTIYCKKIRTVTTVTAVSPKCPRGYTKTSKPVAPKPKATVPSTRVAKSRSAACVTLRNMYNQASRTSNAYTFEIAMNNAVNTLRKARWDSTADSIVNFTLQGLRQAALGGIASYLRAYNCA